MKLKRMLKKMVKRSELWTIVADAHLPLIDANPSFHLGAERWFYDIIAARVGYRLGLNDNPSDGLINRDRCSERMALNSLANIDFQFDYAFVPDAHVGHAHRISVITRF